MRVIGKGVGGFVSCVLGVCVFAAGGVAGCEEEPGETTDLGAFPGVCNATLTAVPGSGGAAEHVEEGVEVDYDGAPPAIGDHYFKWYKWGEYDEPLVDEHYVHNLEHGGMAFFYSCAEPCPEVVEGLREFVESIPPDDGGEFRYLLAPYPGLATPVAAAAWGLRYEADCVDVETLDQFVLEHYRTAPEDVAADGQLPEVEPEASE